ncbi:hypothetical protein OC834_003763 [Tilletia horrida]|nr:hypothetical protein OC834_003763 [Tilletia horrida]
MDIDPVSPPPSSAAADAGTAPTQRLSSSTTPGPFQNGHNSKAGDAGSSNSRSTSGGAEAAAAVPGAQPASAIKVEDDAGNVKVEGANGGAQLPSTQPRLADEADDDIVMVSESKARPVARGAGGSAAARNGNSTGSGSTSASASGSRSKVSTVKEDEDTERAAAEEVLARAPLEEEVPQEEIQWMWTAQEWDDWTPSRAAGLDKGQERLNRYAGVKFIFQMAERLQMYGHVLHTASVYFHRFFLRKAMKTSLSETGTGYDYNEIAAACVFLACKNEEQHRKLGQIIETAIGVSNFNSGGRSPLGQNTPENFRRWRDTIIAFEDELFPALCADLVIDQPIAMFIEACQIFGLGREQVYSGIQMLHDINRDIYCQLFEAVVQAAAVFYLVHLTCAADWNEYIIPDELLGEGEPNRGQEQIWRVIFFSELEEVKECAEAIRQFYLWREATVEKSVIELAALRNRNGQATSSFAGMSDSPRRPGSSAAGTSITGQLHPPGQQHPQQSYATASPLPKANGHRHSTHHNASSSSSAYTPELSSSVYGDVPRAGSTAPQPPPPPAQQAPPLPPPPPPQEAEGRSFTSAAPSNSTSASQPNAQDKWKPISSQSRFHQQQQTGGSRYDDEQRQRDHTANSSVLLSPEMPGASEEGGYAGLDGYQMESPKLDQEDEEEEGEHGPSGQHQRSHGGGGGQSAHATSGEARSSASMRWAAEPSAHQPTTTSSSLANMSGLESPVMPVDNDDEEEGAVNDDV